MKSRMLIKILHALLLMTILVALAVVPVFAKGNQSARLLAPFNAPVTIELCASTGSVTMPDAVVVPIWGFSLWNGASCNPAQLPGPVLRVTAGDDVTVILHNQLSQNVSIIFPGQDLFPDSVGAAPGGTVTYQFTANEPGTYLYESGRNVHRQVPMGLYGALIVDSATPGQAYDDPSSAYDAEAVLVLSEVDQFFNMNPLGFNFLNYLPFYFLINGEAYPATNPIAASPGERLLIRYVNAGLQQHTMTLLGQRQMMIARDAYPLRFSMSVVAETIASGSTADMIVDIPSGAAGESYPLYNRQLRLTNRLTFPGGMLTFVNVASGPPPPTPPGPFSKTSPANGAVDVATSPTLSWGASSNAASYEYCYDTSNNATCDAVWTSTGTNTSAALSGLGSSTTYYWQVRAINSDGTTFANAGTWWSFTTQAPPPPPPGAFGKTSPANGAVGVATNPTLSWVASSNAASYEYCYDTSNNATCDAVWTSTGTNTSAALSGLGSSTTYYWQVRAVNISGTTFADSGTWWGFTTLTPPPSDLIFADDFESGNFAAWSFEVDAEGDLNATAGSALEGSFGMDALIDNATGMYLRDISPVNEIRYRARFYFDPNSVALVNGNLQTIFMAVNGGGLPGVRINFHRIGATYQVRGIALSDNNANNFTPFAIISDGPHYLEIDWIASTGPGANNGSLSFWVDGTLIGTASSIDNDTWRVEEARLGPSVGAVAAGTLGSEYFDDFVSRRLNYIGP